MKKINLVEGKKMSSSTTTPSGQAITLKDFIQYDDGSIVSKTIIDKKTGTITLFAFDMGQNLSEHTTPFDALVHVLDGTAELIIGGKSVRVTSGQFCIMPAKIPHAVEAPEKFKMVLSLVRS